MPVFASLFCKVWFLSYLVSEVVFRLQEIEGEKMRKFVRLMLVVGLISNVQAGQNFNGSRSIATASAIAQIKAPVETLSENAVPGFVTTAWLAENLDRNDVKIIDLRKTPKYNNGHIPGSISFSIGALCGPVKGVPATLLPPAILGYHWSLMGIKNDDTVVIVAPGKFQGATLLAVALKTTGHSKATVLQGGIEKWKGEKHLVSTELPKIMPSRYSVSKGHRSFIIGKDIVAQAVRTGSHTLIDARSEAYFTGAKSDEARSGRIPGALSHHCKKNFVKDSKYKELATKEALSKMFAKLVPDKNQPVILYCRTCMSATLNYMIMKCVLGYEDVSIYDGSWSEWSTITELPAVKGATD